MITVLLAATVLSLTNDYVTLTFNDRGEAEHLVENISRRELLKDRTPFVGQRGPKNAFVSARQTEWREGALHFTFGDKPGRLSLKPTPYAGGWTFEVVASELPTGFSWQCGRLYPVCCAIVGNRANMVSDERSAVCLRAYNLNDSMTCGRNWVAVSTTASQALGTRFGLSAGPRDAIREMLKAMTVASGRAHSPAGGAWATDSETARLSYLNADMRYDKLEDWIDLMERGGFGVLHFRESWYARRGHYPVNTNNWPNGLADMQRAVAKIHAAGYWAGMHTLTACIDPKDPWVASEDNRYLRARASYKLAAPISATATELTVTEAPKVTTDVIFNYCGNGNALRLGNEIVQFSSYTKTPPYKYTGLTRGAFGTKPAAHEQGCATDYLEQRYVAFYPDADSPLADKLADAIAHVYNTCQFDQIYCDGTESGITPDWTLHAAKMRDKIIARCAASGRGVINEDSCGCLPHSWWMNSRIGAWDNCWWAPKRFHDYHVASVKQNHLKDGDLMEVQMGWWSPVTALYYWPAQKLDEMEYYASRNVGLDATMSISGINVSAKPLSFHHAKLMTVLGWYERARLARVFAPGLREQMDVKGAEFRLRQGDTDGIWRIAPTLCRTSRATLAEKPVESALRVEACHAGDLAPNAPTRNMTADHRAADLKIKAANSNIVLKASDTTDDQGRKCFRLEGTNGTTSPRGAWAVASACYKPYRSIQGTDVLRFRVKGDGSGALLNVQIHSPREYGGACNEHYVTLDFTGWRDFETAMRETDAERFPDYVWPYTSYTPVYHAHINFGQISEVNFYLNEIPANGRVDIAVSDVTMAREIKTTAQKPTLVLNGKNIALPFDLTSGEFAEYERGYWTLYTPNGEPLQRAPTAEPLAFDVGENTVTYQAQTKEGRPCRAEVKLFAVGVPREAWVDTASRTAQDRKHLNYEATMPIWYEPTKGFDEQPVVAIRPGERAYVEFRAVGKVVGGEVKIGDETFAIAAQDESGTYRCKTQKVLSGIVPFSFKAREAACRLEIIKRYVQ